MQEVTFIINLCMQRGAYNVVSNILEVEEVTTPPFEP